jgi:hypothetical protein
MHQNGVSGCRSIPESHSRFEAGEITKTFISIDPGIRTYGGKEKVKGMAFGVSWV